MSAFLLLRHEKWGCSADFIVSLQPIYYICTKPKLFSIWKMAQSQRGGTINGH